MANPRKRGIVGTMCDEIVLSIDSIQTSHTKEYQMTMHSLEKIYNNRLLQCETSQCGHYILEESMNCVSQCVSPSCHKQVGYDVNPLEEGELDETRASEFAICVTYEILKEKARAKGKSQ